MAIDRAQAPITTIAMPRATTRFGAGSAGLLPLLVGLVLVPAIILPISALLARSAYDRNGQFIGLQNFVRYASEPGLSVAAWNSITLSGITTVLALLIAFPFAYALNRSCIPLKSLFRAIILLPLLAPSLLAAFGLIYLFGTQGWLKGWLLGEPLYGPVGIVLASVYHALPHAVLILSAGLATGDARLYEAARALKAGPWRTFWSVTLPSCRYAIISAASVVFVSAFTEFGIPSVVGGSTNVLATDIYKLVIGRFDFEMGAVVGVLLLLPAVVAYAIDVAARATNRNSLSGRSVPIEPQPRRLHDLTLLAFVMLVSIAILGLLGMAIYGSLVKFWPYNLTLGLHNYERMVTDDDEARALWNSIALACATAMIGTLLVGLSGWLVARRVGANAMTQTLQGLAMVPVAVPGLVLGLGYIFFFNNPANPLHPLQGTMALLVLCTVAHFYTVPHLMAVGALMQMDREIDLAAQALRSGPVGTANRVYLPVLAPTLVDIAAYFFVNAMTTVSALIFLFTAQTRTAAIAVVNLTEGSRFGQGAAMAVLIMLVSIVATLLQLVVRALIVRRQTWRRRAI